MGTLFLTQEARIYNRAKTASSISGSLVAQTVKCLPTMQETQVQSLGQEDLLEKETATHSSIFAWNIPWTEETGGLQSMGWQSRTRLSDFFHFHFQRYWAFSSTLLYNTISYEVLTSVSNRVKRVYFQC